MLRENSAAYQLSSVASWAPLSGPPDSSRTTAAQTTPTTGNLSDCSATGLWLGFKAKARPLVLLHTQLTRILPQATLVTELSSYACSHGPGIQAGARTRTLLQAWASRSQPTIALQIPRAGSCKRRCPPGMSQMGLYSTFKVSIVRHSSCVVFGVREISG